MGSEGSALGLGSTWGMPPARSVLSHSRGTGGLLEAGLSQEGVDTRSSPGPGEEAAQRWDREQAYLAGLAGQYCLERYPDSYEAMCEWAGRGGREPGWRVPGAGPWSVSPLQQRLPLPASCTTGCPALSPSPRTPGPSQTQTRVRCS